VHRIDQFAFPGAGGFGPSARRWRRSTLAGRRGWRWSGLVVAGAVADDQAVADFDDAFGPGRDFAVVGDEDHHVALARQFVEQRHHLGAAVAVEGAGGFVGEDDVAAVHQRPGNRHPLLLAAGQLVRAVAGARGQAQAVEQGGGAGVAFGGGVPA
jgi:hypothetical protein